MPNNFNISGKTLEQIQNEIHQINEDNIQINVNPSVNDHNNPLTIQHYDSLVNALSSNDRIKNIKFYSDVNFVKLDGTTETPQTLLTNSIKNGLFKNKYIELPYRGTEVDYFNRDNPQQSFNDFHNCNLNIINNILPNTNISGTKLYFSRKKEYRKTEIDLFSDLFKTNTKILPNLTLEFGVAPSKKHTKQILESVKSNAWLQNVDFIKSGVYPKSIKDLMEKLSPILERNQDIQKQITEKFSEDDNVIKAKRIKLLDNFLNIASSGSEQKIPPNVAEKMSDFLQLHDHLKLNLNQSMNKMLNTPMLSIPQQEKLKDLYQQSRNARQLQTPQEPQIAVVENPKMALASANPNLSVISMPPSQARLSLPEQRGPLKKRKVILTEIPDSRPPARLKRSSSDSSLSV